MAGIGKWGIGPGKVGLLAALAALGPGCEASLSVLGRPPDRPWYPAVAESAPAGTPRETQTAALTLPRTPDGTPAALPRRPGGEDALLKAACNEATHAGPALPAGAANESVPRVVTGKVAAPPAVPPAPPSTTTLASAGPGAALRLVNSRRIAFHYEVKDPGTAGPVAVEVWGSQDLKTWKKYDAVTQKGKAYTIEVREEGLYGFTLLARAAGGGKDGPAPGEPPQVWVAVDCTRPVVQFMGAELNILARAPTLVIRWSAADRNLGPRPVTLLYAERPEGPWMLLADNVENTGRYEWPLPAALPAALFLRVQAADLMGNVGLAQTPNLLYNVRAGAVAGRPGPAAEPARDAGPMLPEPELPRQLPPTPAVDLTRGSAPAAPPARAEISIVTVEPERN
jgi:hypothetical protein